ncbi:MAG: hypothetical protein ACPL28_08675 [bacterium]
MKYIIGHSDELTEIEFMESVKRPLWQRINNSFIKTYKPVIDDAPYRIFNSMVEYRRWCQKNLPGWLGYGK